MRVRDPKKAEAFASLISSHKDLAHLTRRFASAAIDEMLHPGEAPREWFGSMARAFVDTNRAHMALEEEKFFPVALQVLSDEDWAKIDTQVTDQEDPLFGDRIEARFEGLHPSILDLDRSSLAREPV